MLEGGPRPLLGGYAGSPKTTERVGQEGSSRRGRRSVVLSSPFVFSVEVSMGILMRDARFWVALLLLIRSVLFFVVPRSSAIDGGQHLPWSCWRAAWRGTTSFRRGGRPTRPRLGRSASSRHGRGTRPPVIQSHRGIRAGVPPHSG